MRTSAIVVMAVVVVMAFVGPALALSEVTPLGSGAVPTVAAAEPLAALAVGLGLLGARLLRRRR